MHPYLLCTLSKHSVTKFSVISSVQYTLHFFAECFLKEGTFYEKKYDNMVLSAPAKSGLESGAWFNVYDYQNKDKNIPKIRVRYLFVQYHRKNNV